MSKKGFKKVKSVAVRALFLCLFAVLCSFMLTFLPENEDAPVNEDATPVLQKSFEEILFSSLDSYDGEYLSSEYSLSDAVYDENLHTLVLLDKQAEENFGILPKEYSITITDENGESTQKPIFSSSMGYIFYDDGEKKCVLSNQLLPLLTSETDEFEFLCERDKSSRPVFLVNSQYVTLDPGTGERIPVEYDESLDRGIDFGYPSYYGSYEDQSICITKSAKGYGFSRVLSEEEQKEREEREKEETDEDAETQDDSIIAQAGYAMAYNFSEGRGCIKDFKNRLYFFDERGRLPAGGLVNIIYGPKDDSEKYLGYYYFCEGLTRACEKTFSSGKLVSEREIIIRRDGRQLPLPADYSIISYSDGMILLDKCGYRGYMDSNGVWITNPTFTYARPFFEGLAVVGSLGGKKGVMDKEGNIVIPAIFDEITDCSGGVICLYKKDHGWFVINKLAYEKAEE